MLDRLYILDDDSQPVRAASVLAWARWLEAARLGGELHVADDTFGDVRVSTVFLGIDHGFDDTPLLFETMIFVSSGGPASDLHEWQARYTTREEAELGHAAAVALVTE